MSARTLRLRAPAKLNLGLRIVAVRDDGYHELESVFVPLALADELVLAVDLGAGDPSRVDLEIGGEGAEGLPEDASNLAARAARAFLDAAGVDASVRIALRKRVPSGAGLGGGSSDAAAVLRGLDELLPGAVAPTQISRLALSLGADVPFFLQPRPARVSGVGEHIEPLPGVPELSIALAHPGKSLATADVYAAYDALGSGLTPRGAGPTMPAVFGSGASQGALAKLLHNDLEPAAVGLCPGIGALREQLSVAGALATGMSGSGAAVYGVFADDAAARAAAAQCASPVWACATRSEGSVA